MAAPRCSSAAALMVAAPLLPQRFNGPCGLLAAVQAEMLLVASSAADEASGGILNAAVERMLLRAARANTDADAAGRGQFLSVTRLLCHACHSPLSVSAPIEEDGSYEEVELEGSVATAQLAHACACGCPPLLRLSWSGPLWSTLEVLSCFCICVRFSLVILQLLLPSRPSSFGFWLTPAPPCLAFQCGSCRARSCLDCALVEYEHVTCGGCSSDDDDSHSGAAAALRCMPPVRTGLGEALLLLSATQQCFPAQARPHAVCSPQVLACALSWRQQPLRWSVD